MLQDIDVETAVCAASAAATTTAAAAAAADNDDDDDDEVRSGGCLPLFNIFLCWNYMVPLEKKIMKKKFFPKFLNIENLRSEKRSCVFNTSYEGTNHCKNKYFYT